MQKFPELQPKQLEYLRNVFYNSDIFKKKVEDLRKKYGLNKDKTKENFLYTDKIQLLRLSKEAIDLEIDLEKKKLWLSFNNDLEEISEYFCLCKYFIYFKRYVLFRGFEPLDFQKILKIDKDKITLELPFQITKTEFDKIWLDIQFVQKSTFAKGATNNEKIRERKNLGNFDLKFMLYRNKNFGDKLPEKTSSQVVKSYDRSNIYNRIKEIDNQIKSL